MYLRGVDRVLAERAGSGEQLVRLAEWTVGEARARPLLRALLTGCWGERLPTPRPASRSAAASALPAQRRADAGHPAPAELVAAVRDRSLAAQEPGSRRRTKEESLDLAHRCELAVRLALAHVVAPAPEGVGPLVRNAVSAVYRGGGSGSAGNAVSGSNPTAAGR
ncbi:TetR/AcrR family transcriptional regulator, partial [Streptomyces sp. NPDC054841]